jgi:hypothetical protein
MLDSLVNERKLIRRPEQNSVKNVQMMVEGNILPIKVDLTKEFGPSSSGKTIIATTRGTCRCRIAMRRSG